MVMGTTSSVLHVFVDILILMVQALRPITNKWIQLSVINTFDPIIFIILSTGVLLWILGIHPYIVFPIILILIGYYIVRFKMQAIRKQALQKLSNRIHQ